MDIKNIFETLETSKEFIEFSQNEEGFVLAHAYYEKEHNKEKPWEFGFYNKERDRMVVFATEPILRAPEQEVFKKGDTVRPLDLEAVKISYEEAMQICETHRKEKYANDNVTKYLVILQHLHKQLWNITLITPSFDLINVKIDTSTGDVISSNKSSIFDLGVKDL